MVESCDRKADYIIIITFDPFYVDGKCALDAVSAGFVKRITAVNISMKILFCDRIKGDIRFFRRMYVRSAAHGYTLQM